MHLLLLGMFGINTQVNSSNIQVFEDIYVVTHLILIVIYSRAIINHFTPKVDSWAAVNHLSSLTEEQVIIT